MERADRNSSHTSGRSPMSPSEGVAGSEKYLRGVKRQRVSLACSRCRTKKSRCDGMQPMCSMCKELGTNCVYQHPASSMRLTGSEFSESAPAWEDRMKALEDRMSSYEAGVSKSSISGVVSTPESQIENRPSPQPFRSVSTLETAAASAAGGVVINQVALEDRVNNSDHVDGMAVIAFADEQGSGFFGPSSNISFMGHITKALIATCDRNFGSAPDRSETEGAITSIFKTNAVSSKRIESDRSKPAVNLLALPPDSEVMALIKEYFSNTGLLFPYVLEGSLYKTYALVKCENFTKVRRSWLGLLNVILASATFQLNSTGANAAERIDSSDVFYQRALGLYEQRNLESMNLEIVQSLLLMVQYLQGTQRSAQTWTIHGLAVKAAFQLGLYADQSSRNMDPEEREARKRTWYGCVMLDRTLSMTFGRPSNIPDKYVRLDPAVVINPVSLEMKVFCTSESAATASVCFFNATIALYRIIWMIIDSLYGQNLGTDAKENPSEVVCNVVTLEQELENWRRNLPSLLQYGNDDFHSFVDDADRPVWDRLSRVLRLRYLNVRVLLHRSILTKLLDHCGSIQVNEQESGLYRQMGASSVELCLNSATEIISLVHSARQKGASLGAWWFSLYYTFNAALVIFAISIIRPEIPFTSPGALLAVNSIEGTLNLAVEALRNLDSGNVMVDRCRHYLKKLIEMKPGASRSASRPGHPDLGIPQDLQTESHQITMVEDASWSPLGFELGEFMVEGGLDFLADFFDMPQ